MAQSIHLMGADWPDVPSVILPKTSGGSAVFADPTVTTATANDVASGKVFIDASGNVATGTSTGGGGGTPTPAPIPSDGKTIKFIDYDGTLLYSYTVDEALALTELPPNPTHSGLTAQGWNYTLAEVKNECNATGGATIGQTYTTDDGKTRIYIQISDDTPVDQRYMIIRFTSSATDNVTLDWGDGTIETKGATSATNYSHTYTNTGNYVITLQVNTGNISFIGTGGDSTSGQSIFGSRNKTRSFLYSRIYKIEIGDFVQIVDSCFSFCSALTTITIPNTISSISSSYCWYRCYLLRSITIPKIATSIKSYCFSDAYSLESISIPCNVTNINGYTFMKCYSLRLINIPSSVTGINAGVFKLCYSLASIKIPDGVTSIETETFSNCYSLTSIEIPDSVTRIGTYAFQYCNSLKSIEIPDGVTSIKTYAFQYCYSLKSIKIPDSVTSIETYAFQYCTSLKSIEIPDGVTSIGAYAFQYCYSLKSIKIPDGVTTIGTSTLGGCYSLMSIEIPDSVTGINAYTFQNCYSLMKIVIPQNITLIGNGTFNTCYGLTTITIPSGLTTINADVFKNCYSISEIHMLSINPPTLANVSAFSGINMSYYKIYVPYSADHSILEAYKTATNWSTYAAIMVEEEPT